MKNLRKTFMVTLYILSIVVALGMVMKCSESKKLSEGNGDPGCYYMGYEFIDCHYIDANCDNGSVAGPVIVLSETGFLKEMGTSSIRGFCIGGEDCSTPYSSDLTSVGCVE